MYVFLKKSRVERVHGVFRIDVSRKDVDELETAKLSV